MGMLIDMTAMLAGETDKIDFDFSFTFEDKNIISGVAFPDPFTVTGSVTNNAGYMRLTSETDIPYRTYCARCLKEIDRHLPLSFEKNVAVLSTLQNKETDDYLVIEDASLDLYIPLYEEILLEFPTRLLCDEECKGLCPKCGKNLNDGDCSCNKKEIDPRLAKIAQYIDQLDD